MCCSFLALCKSFPPIWKFTSCCSGHFLCILKSALFRSMHLSVLPGSFLLSHGVQSAHWEGSTKLLGFNIPSSPLSIKLGVGGWIIQRVYLQGNESERYSTSFLWGFLQGLNVQVVIAVSFSMRHHPWLSFSVPCLAFQATSFVFLGIMSHMNHIQPVLYQAVFSKMLNWERMF